MHTRPHHLRAAPFRATLAASVLALLPVSIISAQSGGIDPFAPGQPANQPSSQPSGQPANQPGGQPARAGGSVDLRPKLEKGKVFRFRMNLNSTEKTTPPPQDGQDPNVPAEAVDATQDQEIVLKMTVKDSNPETGSTLELVYESLKMKVANPMLGEDPIEFDSTKAADPNDPAAAAIAEMLGSIVGTSLTISMDKDGNVTNVAAPTSTPALTEGFTGKDVISGLVGQVFTIKKGDPVVRVGEKWTNDSTVAGPLGRTRVTTNNTLRSHSGGKANITIDGNVSMEPNSPGQTLAISIKDSRLDGNAVWNTEDGMLDSMTVSQTLNIDITTPAGPQRSNSTKRTTVTRLK